jgi:ankyrin repeat protein
MSEIDQETINQFVGAAHGNFDAVKKLLAAHPAILNEAAAWGETAIQAAAQMARRDIAEFLLANGAPLDICTAAMLGRREEVKAMLAANSKTAQVHGAHGIPLLYFPAIVGRKDIAELVYAAGAAVNGGEGVSTPLHGAIVFDQVEMATWLLAHGADPSAKDYEGKTPLEAAQAAQKTAFYHLFVGQTHAKEE